jgi:hypothetical protein
VGAEEKPLNHELDALRSVGSFRCVGDAALFGLDWDSFTAFWVGGDEIEFPHDSELVAAESDAAGDDWRFFACGVVRGIGWFGFSEEVCEAVDPAVNIFAFDGVGVVFPLAFDIHEM